MNEPTVPQHIAIIPDGNRRWAKQRNLDPWKGHEVGSNRFTEIAEAGFTSGVAYMTFYAASEDNLRKRPQIEVAELLRLMRQYLATPDAVDKFVQQQVRVRVLGRWPELIPSILHEGIHRLEKETSEFSKHNLTFLLGYDGQSEMLAALNHLVVTKQAIDAATLRAALWTADLPPVDLVIRTGGEPHWSAGFMMWHVANSQLYFTDTLWPDFDSKELQKALDDFKNRERRLGK
jgi:undecaprenyl diphosphate synthase